MLIFHRNDGDFPMLAVAKLLHFLALKKLASVVLYTVSNLTRWR